MSDEQMQELIQTAIDQAFEIYGSSAAAYEFIFLKGWDAHKSASQDVECQLCVEGNPRIRSSVSDAWIHTDTPVGRVVCSQEETPAEQALRRLASYVGNGGYNAPTVDAAVFEAKIRDGIDTLTRVENARGTACKWKDDKDTPLQTGCGHTFTFEYDGITENQFKFCPYCGGSIKEIPYEGDE